MNKQPTQHNWRDGCEHCTSGWFPYEVIVAEAPLPRPFTDAEWKALGRIDRDALLIEYGSRDAAMFVGRAIKRRVVVRCMCRAGQAKDSKVPNVVSTLSVAEVAALWPHGLPSSSYGVSDGDLQRVGLPSRCWYWTLDTFDAKFKGDDDAQKYLKLAREWARGGGRRSDVVIFGPNGTGKSGLAVSLLHALIGAQHTGRFISAREMMLEIRDTYKPDSPKSELDIVNKFIDPYVLVLDELSGTNATDATADTVTMIVDKRQKLGRPTLITMNIGQDLGPEQAARELAAFVGPTLFDRLRENASFWALFGKSKRATNRNLVNFDDFKREREE